MKKALSSPGRIDIAVADDAIAAASPAHATLLHRADIRSGTVGAIGRRDDTNETRAATVVIVVAIGLPGLAVEVLHLNDVALRRRRHQRRLNAGRLRGTRKGHQGEHCENDVTHRMTFLRD